MFIQIYISNIFNFFLIILKINIFISHNNDNQLNKNRKKKLGNKIRKKNITIYTNLIIFQKILIND